MTQQRFEANTLAEVLAKVQKEVGPDAKIASAQKVRSGGAFGFFQREKFEVVVDIAASRPVLLSEHQQAISPASILELAEEFNKQETRIAEPIAPEPTMSTESSAFADVLSRMAFQADMHEETPKVFTPPVVEKTPPPAPKPAPKRVEEEPVILESAPEPEPTPIEPEPTPAPIPAPEPVPAVASSPKPVAPPAPVAIEASKPVVMEAEPLHQTPAVREALPLSILRTRITDHPLAKLGLPAPYIPTQSDIVDLRSSLTQTLTERLPRVPAIKPSKGSIIAVVGHKEEAMKLAQDLAVEFGRPKEEVMLATQYIKATVTNGIVNSIQNAEDMHRSWSRRKRPTIIAIDAALGSRDAAWAEHVLTALEPIATFGVVDATRKCDDVSAWADALGGIDCIALNKLEETVSPASVLQSGIPVERIDGRKATPEYWAVLLSERLPAA